MGSLFLGSEAWRQLALVKRHAFGDIHAGLNRLGLLDGNNAVLAHLVYNTSEHFADLWLTGRHGSNLRNLWRRVNRGRTCLELFHCLFCSSRDTAVELNRVGTRSNVTQTFKNQGLCQKRSSRGAVTSVVVGLGRNG